MQDTYLPGRRRAFSSPEPEISFPSLEPDISFSSLETKISLSSLGDVECPLGDATQHAFGDVGKDYTIAIIAVR